MERLEHRWKRYRRYPLARRQRAKLQCAEREQNERNDHGSGAGIPAEAQTREGQIRCPFRFLCRVRPAVARRQNMQAGEVEEPAGQWTRRAFFFAAEKKRASIYAIP